MDKMVLLHYNNQYDIVKHEKVLWPIRKDAKE